MPYYIVAIDSDTGQQVVLTPNLHDNAVDLSSRLVKDLKKMTLPFAFDSIYTLNSSSFSQLPYNLPIGQANDYYSGITTTSSMLLIEANVEIGASGEVELFNLTDNVSVSGSTVSISAGTDFSFYRSAQLALTQNKTYKLRGRRVGGIPVNKIFIRSASLIITPK